MIFHPIEDNGEGSVVKKEWERKIRQMIEVLGRFYAEENTTHLLP
jgi:hypothetical protein